MAWKHRLTEKDLDNRTAVCAIDGPVKIASNGACQIAVNEISRIGKYRRKYGIDVVTLDEVCEICGGSTRMAYDHNHKTGEFRGWLCMKCNTALGLVGDKVETLEKMIEYLKK